LDVYHTSAHGVALVRIWNAGLKCAARGSLKIAIWAPSHNFVGYIFATKACIDNRKKILLSSNISSTYPHNMVHFGPLAAEIVLGIWGTPSPFSGFRGTACSSGRQPNFAALNRGCHLCSAGRPSRWALAHISNILYVSILLLVWQLAVANVQPVDKRIVFGQVAIHLTATRYGALRNVGRNHAYFQVVF